VRLHAVYICLPACPLETCLRLRLSEPPRLWCAVPRQQGSRPPALPKPAVPKQGIPDFASLLPEPALPKKPAVPRQVRRQRPTFGRTKLKDSSSASASDAFAEQFAAGLKRRQISAKAASAKNVPRRAQSEEPPRSGSGRGLIDATAAAAAAFKTNIAARPSLEAGDSTEREDVTGPPPRPSTSSGHPRADYADYIMRFTQNREAKLRRAREEAEAQGSEGGCV
jgi:hypothetical protein